MLLKRDKSRYTHITIHFNFAIHNSGARQDTARETSVSERMAADWYNFFRDVCAQYFFDHPIITKGPGKIVEIDESKFGKWKCNQGRAVDGYWVSGGIERGTTKSFRMAVDDGSVW